METVQKIRECYCSVQNKFGNKIMGERGEEGHYNKLMIGDKLIESAVLNYAKKVKN